MNLDKAITSRYSCKKFKNKKPDWRDIIECIDFCRYAPMAGNIFSLRFVIVDDKKKIEKLAEASQQNFISEVDYIVVVYSDPSLTENSFDKRAKRYCRQQAGAAIQNFLLKITEKKLATCWIGHFVDSQIKEIVKIPEKCYVEALFPIGYEYTSPKKRGKIDINSILYFNKAGNKKMKNPKSIDV